MPLTRREFLLQAGHACAGYALGAAAFAAGIQRFGLINALAQGTDYRALVCVFLAGGNDGNNLVVPTSSTEYSAYSAVRSASGLAIPLDSLLPIVPASINSAFGLASEPGGIARALVPAEAVGRVQCRTARAADQPGAVSGGRAPPVSALLAFGSSGAMADLDRRPDRVHRMGRPGGRPVSRSRFRRPDDHGAVRRPVYARAIHLAALDRRRPDGAQSGTGAERLQDRCGRGRAPAGARRVARPRRGGHARRVGEPNDGAGARHRSGIRQRCVARHRCSRIRRSAIS